MFDSGSRTHPPTWIAAVGAAAAAAAAAAALAGGRPTPPNPGEVAGYVLQLSGRSFRVGLDTPTTLQATAWRVDASGGMQPAPEASLRVEVTRRPVAPGRAGPGVRRTDRADLTPRPATTEVVTLSVVGSAPTGEIVETVTVAVDLGGDYRAELI